MRKKEFLAILFVFLFVPFSFADTFPGKLLLNKDVREENRKKEFDDMQKEFQWWPTDAQPSPVPDPRGGNWWWPQKPGSSYPWGNRGYIYFYKIIYDYKADEREELAPVAPIVEAPAPEPQPVLRPSLLIKRILRNVKVYFDYNKADLREDTIPILEKAVNTLKKNPDTSILITGNADIRGSENYNEKLGKRRGESVKQFMLDKGITDDRIKIVSRGKLDAASPITDLIGMQKDRNAQFMIAEVEELMLPDPGAPADTNAKMIEEGKYEVDQQERVESAVQVSTKEYTIKKNESLWNIAKDQLGSGHRWKYLYEFNKDRIKDPNKLKAGQVILIPVE